MSNRSGEWRVLPYVTEVVHFVHLFCYHFRAFHFISNFNSQFYFVGCYTWHPHHISVGIATLSTVVNKYNYERKFTHQISKCTTG